MRACVPCGPASHAGQRPIQGSVPCRVASQTWQCPIWDSVNVGQRLTWGCVPDGTIDRTNHLLYSIAKCLNSYPQNALSVLVWPPALGLETYKNIEIHIAIFKNFDTKFNICKISRYDIDISPTTRINTIKILFKIFHGHRPSFSIIASITLQIIYFKIPESRSFD